MNHFLFYNLEKMKFKKKNGKKKTFFRNSEKKLGNPLKFVFFKENHYKMDF